MQKLPADGAAGAGRILRPRLHTGKYAQWPTGLRQSVRDQLDAIEKIQNNFSCSLLLKNTKY
ncbi:MULTISPECIES: hypothetical protein [unclassified Rhizobium]|uniref:hypothetical protein n=1 Tax=unclassified Rhizobium TaxID=2613769 RepID=UPI001ADC0A37|nr:MULTISPECIES: hypothetical protein [unclassified Rhizobium]MBO9099252.1 hypothetical protein [Rhizobium sp. L58/93]MBO9131942.1 hypothetical protein [Rhizobium sp. B209b/85]MBO9169514.1 hypothetical protein [Rhizobium sp. L245/93]MBO9185465.1 hypothetical protein [Rhizobium sp. E27B/91]QXZ85598.1 hypothetical protein J5287_08855 [Rhizobium sp. K1/93]